ncbi:arrestin domain-containing protein 1b isoform X2 [Alosa pseudoharengus]|uniref:arrestin domain-containing protein 1b isoform X2 n=1 Tax=Alosa pseudoharengus TaxID=34774 RepID=UPI003F89756C
MSRMGLYRQASTASPSSSRFQRPSPPPTRAPSGRSPTEYGQGLTHHASRRTTRPRDPFTYSTSSTSTKCQKLSLCLESVSFFGRQSDPITLEKSPICTPSDTHTFTHSQQPSCAVVTKKFNYLLVKTGTLMLKTRSDLRGYTPGQVIQLATEIHNKSGKDTGYVLASLVQKVTYKGKRPLMDLRTIAEVEGAGVKAGKHAEWREQIIVPPLPQSALTGCSLIDIDYFIQVSLKSPEVVVTLPIFIGNIAVNLTPSRPMPPHPGTPLGAMSSPCHGGVVPSAPPAEEDPDSELGAGGLASEEIPTKSHSQQDPSGQPATVSPSAFGYASGLSTPQGQRSAAAASDGSAALFCVSTGATIPFFTEGNATPVPTSCSLILPPEYSRWDFPPEPPPTYEESCSSNNSSFNR